ncbi:hypothetical protein BGX38DRAFT_1244422, partial [Terfezia claveryi]
HSPLPTIPLPPLFLFPLLPLSAPVPVPNSTPYKFSFNLLGLKPVTLSISPTAILSHSEPFLYKTTTTLAAYRDPEDFSREPNRLLEHRKNTQAHVDQNGVLDERHYRRYEEMFRDGTVVVEVGPEGERRLDVRKEGVNNNNNDDGGGGGGGEGPDDGSRENESSVSKNNGMEKDPSSGKTTFEKYLDGEIDTSQQSIFGKDIPREYSDDEAVRARYGLSSAPAKKKKMVSGEVVKERQL